MTTAAQGIRIPDHPTAQRALDAPLDDQEAKRVLVSIALMLDMGMKPTVRQIMAMARLDDVAAADDCLRRLEAAGVLRVKWVTKRDQRRLKLNRYKVLV